MSNDQSMRLKRWQAASLIGMQLLFAACATSVLFYRAQGWAPDVINFEWLSYRAFNIYLSLLIIGCLVWGLLRGYRHVLPLLAAFSLFHLVEGALIAFWAKAVIHLVTLIILAWMVHEKGRLSSSLSSIGR